MTDEPYNPFTGGLTPAQSELVVGQLDDGTEIAEIMRQFYPLLLERAWERAGGQVQLGLAFDLRNPRVQETIAGLAQKVRRVADVTRDEVRAVLARVDAEGLSYQQAAALLRGVVETTADGVELRPFDSAYRSFMIAVTESAYAYSRGQRCRRIPTAAARSGRCGAMGCSVYCHAAGGAAWHGSSAQTRICH